MRIAAGDTTIVVERGVLRSLSGPDGREWVARPAPLLSVALEEWRPVTTASWQWEEEGLRLRGRGDGVRITLAFARAAQGVAMTPTLTAERRPVTGLAISIGGLACPEAATFTWPLGAGALAPAAALSPGTKATLTYPVYASMAWLGLFTPKTGLYLGAHDPMPYLKALHIGREEEGLFLSIEYLGLSLEPGRTLTLPPAVIAAHQGDWHEGARIYRSWALSRLDHEEPPAWYAQAGAHNTFVMKSQGAPEPRWRFSDLPRLGEEAAEVGVDVVHIAGYMEGGHDTGYPDYVPGPSLGGEEGLARAAQELHASGRRLCLYTNGRIVDPDATCKPDLPAWSVKWPPGARQWYRAMWDRMVRPGERSWDPRSIEPGAPSTWNARDAGGMAVEECWPKPMAALCPSVPEWRELFISRLEWLSRAFSPDCFQVDQVCGCFALPCGDERHEHPHPSLAWSWYEPFMRELRRRLRRINPEVALWTEGVNDILGQPFDCLQATLAFTTLLPEGADWAPPLFRYTLPEYMVMIGDLDELYQTLWTFVSGCFYHFHIPDFPGLSTRLRRIGRFCVAHRRRLWEVFTGGEVLPEPAVSQPGLRCMAWRLGERLVITGAPIAHVAEGGERAGGPIDAEVALPQSIRGGLVFTPGRSEPTRVEGGTGVLRVEGEDAFLAELAT